MKTYQQKSFESNSSSQRRSGQRTSVHTAYAPRQFDVPGAILVWLLKKIMLVGGKLFVLLKYQFYKRTAVAPSTVKLPVLKLAVVGMLAFVAFRDLSLQVGGGAKKAHFGGPSVVEEIALHEGEPGGPWAKFTSLFEEKDPFAEDPSDSEEDRKVKSYVRRFKDLAIAEKEKYGIPASIKMAQGIVESNAGKSALSRQNNNHFGIKCFSRTCRKGHCSNFGDDSHKDFFRKYDNAWESWRAHSQLLVNGKYKSLLKYGDDYRKWARGLKKMGYATAKDYEQTLVSKIEKYQLYKLDE
jgi:hypothetical protein